MQPFGLLNFLQKALSSNEDNQAATSPSEDVPAQETKPVSPPPTSPSPEEAAYNAFVSKHEQFSKRIHKKN